MIGEKVTIRIRMNTGDAHYAGELVNGSHMLDFFGDVATELLIRMDGDEGLLRRGFHGVCGLDRKRGQDLSPDGL